MRLTPTIASCTGGQGKRIKIWPTVFPGPGATWAPKEHADGAQKAFPKVPPDASTETGSFNAFTLYDNEYLRQLLRNA